MIFNELIASSGGGGGKVATWTVSSGGSASATNISFEVEGEPTEWLLMCAGTPNSSVTASLYMIINALKQSSSYVEGTYMRAGGRIYSGQNIISTSYSNNIFTLTAETNYGFMRYGGSSAGYATYYLLYNTN